MDTPEEGKQVEGKTQILQSNFNDGKIFSLLP
jgi:hypothetical protein